MQAHIFSRYFLFSKNCNFYPFKKIIYPLLLPSHNCIIFTMFSFQGAFLSFQRNSMKFQPELELQSVSLEKWWRLAGSNRWPPACKAGALPAELNPHINFEVVGQNGLEPSTSRLSVVCSSQLSYWPVFRQNQSHNLRIWPMSSSNARLCLCFSSPHQTRFAGLCRGPHFFFTS